MNQKIIVNVEALSQSFIPEKILHREKELAQLSDNLQNFVSTTIIGSCGFGKTTLVKRTVQNFNNSKKGHACYVDCTVYQTTYSVLKEIIPKSEFVLYRSNYELIKELLKQTKERKFAICLDNFEHLKEKELIAKFMTIGLSVILVSDNEENFSSLSENIRSNIPSIIRLSNYSAEQAFDILKDRAEKALAKWTYSDSVIKKIAERIKGNIALGINALKLAALKAESENKKAVEESDVPEISNDCPAKLSEDERVLLNILKEWKSLPSCRLYAFYREHARHPKGERAFRNYMQSLCTKNLAKAIGDKRGRIYEIVESGQDASSQS